MPSHVKPHIIIDHRERPSGITKLLEESDALIEIKTLTKGDYLINEHLLVERKTKNDFALSIIQNRLFTQCRKIKESKYNCILLIEGNPYQNTHNISQEAVNGAIHSVSSSWQVPIIYTKDIANTAQTIITLSQQSLHHTPHHYRYGYKPKTLPKQQLYFLIGLPMIGTKTARALLKQFSSIEQMMNATTDELMQVEGIGKKKAQQIREFILKKHNTNSH